MSTRNPVADLAEKAHGLHPRLWPFGWANISKAASQYGSDQYQRGVEYGRKQANAQWGRLLREHSNYDAHRDAYEIRMVFSAEEITRMTGRMR